jgi:hypothetical protein
VPLPLRSTAVFSYSPAAVRQSCTAVTCGAVGPAHIARRCSPIGVLPEYSSDAQVNSCILIIFALQFCMCVANTVLLSQYAKTDEGSWSGSRDPTPVHLFSPQPCAVRYVLV